MLNKKEIIGVIIIFFITYFIILFDHILISKNKCKSDECHNVLNSVQIHIPILVAIISLLICKIYESQINDYIYIEKCINQPIITDMFDF
jgi:tellurite resistance protein TehA-like permease